MSENSKKEIFARTNFGTDGTYTLTFVDKSLPVLTYNPAAASGPFQTLLAAKGASAIVAAAMQSEKTAAAKHAAATAQVAELNAERWVPGEREGGFRFDPILVAAIAAMKDIPEDQVRAKLAAQKQVDSTFIDKLKSDSRVAAKMAELIRKKASRTEQADLDVFAAA
jgi:hypothetical protein